MDKDRARIGGYPLAPLPTTSLWRDGLFAAMPVVAIAILVTLLGLLLWMVERDEHARQRLTLISDALWVEQTLRFQLVTDEDHIARLALDVGRASGGDAAPLFRNRASLFVTNNPEIRDVAWFGPDGRVRASVPERPASAAPPPALSEVARRARFSARPIYGDLRDTEAGERVVDLAMALPGTGEAGGAVVASISVSGLLARHVPWWIGEKYAVRLATADGTVVAERARGEPFDPELFHTMSFDPPISGTVLNITPYRSVSEFSNNALYASIIGLAVLAVVSLVALQNHIARRRTVEQQLRTEAAFRRAMEDSLIVGMRARDLDGRILYVNPAFCRMVGYSAADLIGQAPPMPYWIPEEMAETRARHDAQIRGELKPRSWETRFRRRDGTMFDALIYDAPLIDESGLVRGWMGSIIDITDRKEAAEFARLQAESLQRTGRLVTLGEMASTLAHELNQPLAAIASYAAGSLNLIRAGRSDTAALAGALEKLAVQAQRAGHIIRRIQDFVRKREPRLASLAIGEVIADTIAFARVDARYAGVKIEVAVDSTLPPVTADRILIEQVLLNLVRNGAEAMADCPPDQRVLTVSASSGPAGDVQVEVSDRGTGIAPDVAGRLFDPFVSTKSEGMGMGLNICRSIVELHKGRLTHRPRVGGGTVFAVSLPATLQEAA